MSHPLSDDTLREVAQHARKRVSEFFANVELTPPLTAGEQAIVQMADRIDALQKIVHSLNSRLDIQDTKIAQSSPVSSEHAATLAAAIEKFKRAYCSQYARPATRGIKSSAPLRHEAGELFLALNNYAAEGFTTHVMSPGLTDGQINTAALDTPE